MMITKIIYSKGRGWARSFFKPVTGLFFCLFLSSQSMAFDFSELSKEQKVKTVNIGGVVLITAWGIISWDYFSRTPFSQSEGWFGEHTKHGGADKAGHFETSFIVGKGLSYLYEKWGYEPERAAKYAALSTLALLGYMELGDSFSDHGFSYEDMVMNVAGSVASYYMNRHPGLSEKIDFRFEYAPTFDNSDIFTDYDNYKYLAALKLDGFDRFKNTPLKYLELHVGYYARGYEEEEPIRERNLYFGIGINLSRLFFQSGYPKVRTALKYYQPPYTYLSIENDFDD